MSTPTSGRGLRIAIVLWGVLGVVLVLIESIHRLGMTADRIIREEGLTKNQQLVLALWTVAICYVEGYKGFQRRFSPRVVARALYLAEHRRPLHVALAPLYCMALFHTTRRRLLATWYLVAGIVTLIVLVRQLSPPYRAIVDAGVASALAWGTVAMLVYLVRGLSGSAMPVAPDMPEDAAHEASRSRELEGESAGSTLSPKVLGHRSPSE